MSQPPRASRPSRGFTLIELMITVAIVAVLASVAYPSYIDYVRKGRRATAQAALMDVASRQQTYLLDRRAYAGALADLSFTTPAELAGHYTITVAPDNTVTPPTFVAKAAPSSALKAKGEPDLTINQAGVKAPANYWTK